MTPRALADSNPKPFILDLRLPDDYESGCIPGAHNNCVFEVAFTGRLNDLIPDLETEILIYGANRYSHETTMAATKLNRAGYHNIRGLEGGYEAWIDAELPVVGNGRVLDVPSVEDRSFHLDPEECSILWTGRNLLNNHKGELKIAEGEIRIEGGLIISGEVTIDMESITCTDLEGDMRDGLIAHLKSDDFFDVEENPEATLKILGSAPVDGNTIGSPNLQIDGELTMRGLTVPVRFAVTCGITPDERLAAQGTFSIDRTRWGVLYGSGKFFHRIGMHLVNDLIDIEVKMVTKV